MDQKQKRATRDAGPPLRRKIPRHEKAQRRNAAGPMGRRPKRSTERTVGKSTLPLYLLDRLMKRYTYVASTIGGNIAVSELVQQVRDARMVYGPDAYAKVRLSDTWMKTSYSKDGRQRPHFIIVGYTRRRGGGGGGKLVELPDLPETAKLEQLAKPTAKQVLDDEIAF